MPIKEMPAFVFSHKNIYYAVICSLASCFFLFLELILMRKTVITVLFDVIIPFSAAICFGCYAITMAMDRPIILTCPPTAYFSSLLINQLLSVEVGTPETYPIFTFIELIPVLFYFISVSTGKIKKISSVVLKISCVLLSATICIIVVLAIFFSIRLYSKVTQTFAVSCGMISIMCIYMGMVQQLKISGSEKKPYAKFVFFEKPKI